MQLQVTVTGPDRVTLASYTVESRATTQRGVKATHTRLINQCLRKYGHEYTRIKIERAEQRAGEYEWRSLNFK